MVEVSVRRPAVAAITIVCDTVRPCAACGHENGRRRQVGVVLCFRCAGVLRDSCLRKSRFARVGDAVRVGAQPRNTYRCRFCRGLHIARMRDYEEPMKPDYSERLNQVCVALATVGAVGVRLNRNRT